MQEGTRTKETENGTELAGQDERLVILPRPCPWCNSKSIDLSFARGFTAGDKRRPIIGAGCSNCGAVGPMVEFDSINGYEESQKAWDDRAI